MALTCLSLGSACSKSDSCCGESSTCDISIGTIIGKCISLDSLSDILFHKELCAIEGQSCGAEQKLPCCENFTCNELTHTCSVINQKFDAVVAISGSGGEIDFESLVSSSQRQILSLSTLTSHINSLESDDEVKISFQSTLIGQTPELLIESVWISALQTVLEPYIGSLAITTVIDSISLGVNVDELKTSNSNNQFIRLLQDTVDSTVLSYSFNDLSSIVAVEVVNYMTMPVTGLDLIEAYNNAALDSGFDPTTSTSVLTTFGGYELVEADSEGTSSVATLVIICLVILGVAFAGSLIGYLLFRVHKGRNLSKFNEDIGNGDSELGSKNVESTVMGCSSPIVGSMIRICIQLTQVFKSKKELEKHLKEVQFWMTVMQGTLKSLEYPGLESRIRTQKITQCSMKMSELLLLSKQTASPVGLFRHFVYDDIDVMMDEVSLSFGAAMAALQLNITMATIEAENSMEYEIRTLVTKSVEGIQVRLDKLAECAQTRSSDDPDVMPAVVKVPSRIVLEEMKHSLEKQQLVPERFVQYRRVPIGKGEFSRVHMVKYESKIRASKTVSLTGIEFKKLYSIFVKLADDLLELSELRHARVTTFLGCVTRLSDITFVYEYVAKGSLRDLLDAEKSWRKLKPDNKHQILLDIIDGMTFLHGECLDHGNLKSTNILITEDFRAKITDYGFRRTHEAITIGRNKDQTLNATNLAWLAPEEFSRRSMYQYEEDVYSFGIIIWEVLIGVLGMEASTPWKGVSNAAIVEMVKSGKRPILPDLCVIDTNVLHAPIHKQLMKQCLDENSDRRPRFQRIQHRFEAIEKLPLNRSVSKQNSLTKMWARFS